MVKIRIIVLDKTRDAFIREGEEHYLKRIKRYTNIEFVVIKSIKHGGRSDKEILTLERDAIMKRIQPEDYLVALDSKGKEFTSEEFALWLKDINETQKGWIDFIIGGPLGLHKEIIMKARLSLSLSRLTFTHELSRLILLEQIYRAFTIIKGEPYHR